MAEAGLVEARYPIEGIHCEHCATAVVCEFTELDTVQSAEFDFAVTPPELVVRSLAALSEDQITTALQEAGGESYTLGAL